MYEFYFSEQGSLVLESGNNILSAQKIEDSFIYKTFNNSNNILAKMLDAIKHGVIVTPEMIDDQYHNIKKGYISPLSEHVIEAYNNGLIEIIYSKNEKVPTSIPFILRKSGNNAIATIFISSFATLSENKETLNIPAKTLYCIMEAAYIALCYNSYPMKLRINTKLQRLMSDIYTQMFLKILTRDFAITLDIPLYNKVSFIVTKFFLKNMWKMTNNESIFNYATSGLRTPDYNELEQVALNFDKAGINNLSDLINFIKEIHPRMEGLSIKFFIERYISMYNPPALLAADYLPYLFFVIINIRLGSFLVSQSSLSDLIKNTNGINNFYKELCKIY